MDFMHHGTTSGGVFCVLVVVDEFTRELLVLRVARTFTSRATVRIRAEVFAEYGTPAQIRSDNGPEFVSQTTRKYLDGCGVTPSVSRPAEPCGNGLGESTNGKIREELLAPNRFAIIDAAAAAAAACRHDDHDQRPHSALKNMTPSAFCASLITEGDLSTGPKM